MGAVITKDLAERIVKKLKAEIDTKPGRPHDLALVWVEEKMVASFGLRLKFPTSQGRKYLIGSE